MIEPFETPETFAKLNYNVEEFMNSLGFTTKNPAEL